MVPVASEVRCAPATTSTPIRPCRPGPAPSSCRCPTSTPGWRWTGGCSPARGSTPAPSSCSGPRRPRRPGATCSTWAAGTDRSPARWPTGRPAAVVWAVDINDRALELTARNAAALGLPTVRAVRPTTCRRGALRRGLVQPADPHRQGRPARAARDLVAPARARWAGLAGRAPSPGRRLAGGLAAGRGLGGATEPGRSGATGSWRWAGRETAGSDRPQAPPPRVEPADPGAAGPAARRRAVAVQRRGDRPHRGRLPGRAPVPGGRHRLAGQRQGRQAVHGHRAVPVVVGLGAQPRRRRRGPRRRLHRGRPRAGRRRRPVAPAASRSRRLPGARPRGPRPEPGHAGGVRRGGLPAPDRAGSAASTWRRRPPSPSTSCAARAGSRPDQPVSRSEPG